jgi:hypothetical protein
MRLHPKCANTNIPPYQFKLDSGHPRAKIIASRLHYTLLSIATHAARCDAGHASLYYEQSIGHGIGLRNLLFYRTARPPGDYPMHPYALAPNAETPPPIKTRIFYVNKNLLTEQAKFKLSPMLI